MTAVRRLRRPVAAVRSAVAGRPSADLRPGALVLVACSGGPDSLALAAGAAFVGAAARAPWRAGAVVVDHGLQDGSAQVADGRRGGLPRARARPGRGRPRRRRRRGGPEAAARAARYAALDRVADERGAAAVLLGHTLDDQAETVLLGLARGSGARSLAGMPAVARTVPAARCSACAARTPRRRARRWACAPWHDPTNDGAHADAPLRSRVRGEVLPTLERVLGPGVAEALARTAAQLREDADVLDALADELPRPPRARTDGLDVDVAGARRRPAAAHARAAGRGDRRGQPGRAR